MAEQPAAPQYCLQCNTALGECRLTITEHDTASTAIGYWTLCSWACARELAIRFVRQGRDER